MTDEADDSALPRPIEQLLDNADLAGVLESESFRQFLDHLPVALAVSDLRHPAGARQAPAEKIVYANAEFERMTGLSAATLAGRGWTALPGWQEDGPPLRAAVTEDGDFIGTFLLGGTPEAPEGGRQVDAWSNLIEDAHGHPAFRLLALTPRQGGDDRQALMDSLRDKDTLLRELQHRVKNNLQMITALIRLEARNLPGAGDDGRFERLAGRVESLSLLYRALSEDAGGGDVDLGVYLSQIASAVMQAHAPEGIRLNLQVDTWPVAVDVAMPAGLVVNELLTNALKHAFQGRDGGTIRLHSLVDAQGCRVTVADDGIGMPPGAEWPRPGKLGALIVASLRENAGADFQVETAPGQGTVFHLRFTRAAAQAPLGEAE